MKPSVPLEQVSGRSAEMLDHYGAEVSDLYRALANNADVLEAWIAMAWGLRTRATTPRALREVMILRSADTQEATYQWTDHVAMARQAGVSQAKIDSIRDWQEAEIFSYHERLVLRLMDEMLEGQVSGDLLADLDEEFTPSERVELIATAGFYCMVPRVLNALRLEG